MKRVGLLASVTDLAEARLAVQGGADIVDLKNPAMGALGALPLETVRAVVTALHGQRPLSATIGDLPMQPVVLCQAVQAMAATGVDYVKIGFFPGGDIAACMAALAAFAPQHALIAVLLADQLDAPSQWLPALAASGFRGAMLDTQDKSRGSLRQLLSRADLAAFVEQAHALGLLCGLAGALREADIAELAALGPDYLGFRGALCNAEQRTARLEAQALARIRQRLEAVQA